MFRFTVYQACLRFLEGYWRGSKPKEIEVGVLARVLRDNSLHWWKKEGLPKPSPREAQMAAQIFKESRSSGGNSTRLKRRDPRNRHNAPLQRRPNALASDGLEPTGNPMKKWGLLHI